MHGKNEAPHMIVGENSDLAGIYAALSGVFMLAAQSRKACKLCVGISPGFTAI
jgi:hypothetical protein